MPMDRIDFEILAALQKNARLSNKELSALIGLAPSSCLERVRALTKSGALRGFHADVSMAALGIGQEALIAVRMGKHSREGFQRLWTYLKSLPEVLNIFFITGVNDLQVHVAVRDIDHLRSLIHDHFASRPEVSHCETAVIYETHRKHQWPCYASPGAP
jgi:DNA-binding Lrp family transcriptional regulator